MQGGRVVVVPAARGTISIQALNDSDEWVAAFSVRSEFSDEAHVEHLRDLLAQTIGRRIALMCAKPVAQ